MELKKFDFTPELIERFQSENLIPVNFYNKNGQILIHKKEKATIHEINALLRFKNIGIYYDENDFKALTGQDDENIEKNAAVPRGLTSTKLFTMKLVDDLTSFTSELFDRLKREALDSVYIGHVSRNLEKTFDDFSSQPDAMIGLLNILELMDQRNNEYEVELAVKRTVIAMALKTRGMLTVPEDERHTLKQEIGHLMLAALLSDIAFLRMNLPYDRLLNDSEYRMMKNHPLVSYLMVANQERLPHEVKHLILFQHYRQKEKPNNYPDMGLMEKELEKRKDQNHDIADELYKLRTENIYHHDANLIGIASEFACLTTKRGQRASYKPADAVRAIVNDASFTYSYQVMREFLDYSAISLCDNHEIIAQGDLVIVEAASYKGESSYEICMVMESSRFQSRPKIKRFATIYPEIEKKPKVRFGDFKLDSITPDKRHVDIDLSRDNSREIVYIIDSTYDRPLFLIAQELISRT